MTKRILLYGHGGAYNHGAEAIIKTTMDGIRQIEPNVEFLLSTHFPEQDTEFEINADALLTRNEKYVKLDHQTMIPGKYDKEIYQSTIEKITPEMLALSVGGDNYCYPAWHRWRCIHEQVKQRGAKDVLWSCSINPDMLTEQMVNTLQTHDLITVRESITFDALRQKNIKQVKQFPDVAFGLVSKAIPLPTLYDEYDVVAINISPLCTRREKKSGSIVKSVLNLIDFIMNETHMAIAFVPHVVMPMDNDFLILSDLYKRCCETYGKERFTLIGDKFSAAEYKYIISKSKFGIFARTHATIAAYSTNIPCIAIGYSVKAQGIGNDMGMGKYVVPIEELEDERCLLRKFISLNEESERCKEVMKYKNQKVLAMLNIAYKTVVELME